MQTTGRCNYRRIGQVCGVDFEANPDLVFSAQDALKPALAEWSEAGLNVYADNNDILAISRAINCGSPKSKTVPKWDAGPRDLVCEGAGRSSIRSKSGRIRRSRTKSTMTQAEREPRSELVANVRSPTFEASGPFGRATRVLLVREVQLALARLQLSPARKRQLTVRTLSAAKN